MEGGKTSRFADKLTGAAPVSSNMYVLEPISDGDSQIAMFSN